MRALLAVGELLGRIETGLWMRRGRVVAGQIGSVDEVSSKDGANRPTRAATAAAAGRFGQRNHRWPELPDPCLPILHKSIM